MKDVREYCPGDLLKLNTNDKSQTLSSLHLAALCRIMFLVAPVDNNRWVYAMHGLEKPMDHVPGNDLSGVLTSIDREYASSSARDR